MKAAIAEKGKLEIRDIPKPIPRFESALVRIISAGVCHSDIHLMKGDWSGSFPPYAIPLGHEGIGIVEELGTGAEQFVKVGDRVIMGLGGSGGRYWCGACKHCLSGKTNQCLHAKPLFGTYAEYISLWVKSLVRLPDSVSNDEVSLACGGLTSYAAVKKFLKFGILPGQSVAVIGAAGGLGHYAVQLAKAFGYKVVGVDMGKEKIDFVKSLGAEYAVDAADAVEFARRNFEGGVCGSVVFTPKIAGFELGLKMLARGGIFIGVGMPAASEGSMKISPLELLKKDLHIMSSAVGNVEDMRELIRLCSDGKIKSHVSKRAPLSELPLVMEELERGAYLGRAILNDLAK